MNTEQLYKIILDTPTLSTINTKHYLSANISKNQICHSRHVIYHLTTTIW